MSDPVRDKDDMHRVGSYTVCSLWLFARPTRVELALILQTCCGFHGAGCAARGRAWCWCVATHLVLEQSKLKIPMRGIDDIGINGSLRSTLEFDFHLKLNFSSCAIRHVGELIALWGHIAS